MTTVLEQETATSESAAATVARLRASFDSGRTRPLEYRQEQLAGLARFLKERESEIESAIHQDLGRPVVRDLCVGDRLGRQRAGPHPQEAPVLDQAPARADVAGRPARQEPDLSRAAGRRPDHRALELSAPACARPAGRRDRRR